VARARAKNDDVAALAVERVNPRITSTFASGIRDNHTRGPVADFLRRHITADSHLSVVSAFFTIYAYDALKSHLDPIEHMDFLFGEPRFVRSLDPDKTEKKAFVIDADGLKVANTLQQKRVARECADWIRDKVSIRSVRQASFLHGKMYHIANGGVEHAIVGSSNFTTRGLGLSANNNIELNLIVDSERDRTDLKAWFDALWNDRDLVEDVKDEVLHYLGQLYQNHSPEFIYYKTLFHIFERYLGEERETESDIARTSLFDTRIWRTLFEFQRDGVRGAINKILAHNGCILADSVGLGKTYEALAIIKFFELKNERVLVLCPKKLRENWVVYRRNDQLNPFTEDRFRYDVLFHTDLSRERGESGDINLETLNWGNYDLVVIDESHNFRNNAPGRRDETGAIVRRSRYERLMQDIIRGGINTKVLLLSATPVNNDLKDLRNQIYFITAGRDDAFKDSIGIADLKEMLRQAQGHFSSWAKQPAGKRKTAELLARLGSDFFKVLDELTIARARKHIQKYYDHEMERLGKFPERLKPIAISPDIDTAGRFMSYDRLSQEIDGYTLSLFNPSRFLRPDLPADVRADYERRVGNFTQAQREDFLIGMMKVGFLKRLESSVHSFALTMQRTMDKIEALEKRLLTFKAYREQNPEIDVETLSPEDVEDEELRDAFEVGKKLAFKTAHLDVDRWLNALQHDKHQINTLYLQAMDVGAERDAKLAELKRLIAAKARRPTTNKSGGPNRKVLVFTAFADTAAYLYEQLHASARELGIHAALVTGGGDNKTTYQPQGYRQHTEFNHILTNFSPIAKQRAKIPTMPQEGEIDLLIATDCISEGQNLQDCDCLVNYDIHWNPVRIIQRFGRIDRIGSRNVAVQLVNFWPTDNLDHYITLKHRVEARMALVDIAATLEDNLLKPEDLEDLIKDDLRYRDRQLLRLKEEVLDLEDLDDTVALTEFTLDDFRIDLLKYLEANRAQLEEAPFGLYTVVPPHGEIPTIIPGVIFCLRQRAGYDSPSKSAATEQVNPLHPYFLVYVLESGDVRFGFAHPKQILTIYRELCAGKPAPHEALCNLFDQLTHNGSDMGVYDRLLQRAVDSIVATFRKRVAAGLQGGRSFVIPNQHEQANETTDFELVTWLVIKST
jgi:SNF2 family DNA or RNA helicase